MLASHIFKLSVELTSDFASSVKYTSVTNGTAEYRKEF